MHFDIYCNYGGLFISKTTMQPDAGVELDLLEGRIHVKKKYTCEKFVPHTYHYKFLYQRMPPLMLAHPPHTSPQAL